MIKIEANLISALDENNSRHLGTIYIINDNTGNPIVCNYDFIITKWKRSHITLPDLKANDIWKKGHIEGFNRQTRGTMDLLQLVLNKALGNRNKQQEVQDAE